MIFEQSRYETANVVPIADDKGVFHATVVETRIVHPPARYTNHRVVAGDTLDRLAFRAYGDDEKWWVIADANPALRYPDDLVPGTILKVPVT